MKIVAVDDTGQQYDLPTTAEMPKWIKKERHKRKMSLQAVAEQIGVRRQAVWSWEQGATLPTVDNLLKLMSIFAEQEVRLKSDKTMKASLKDVEKILGV